MSTLGLVSLLVLAGVPVDVTLLSGQHQAGQLQNLSTRELSLQPESGPVSVIATADVLELQLTGERPTVEIKPDAAAVWLQLVDGSRLQLTNLKTTQKELLGKHPILGEFRVPLSLVLSLRFTALQTKLESLWTPLLEKGAKTDMIVVQKGDVLDHLDGVVGMIDETTIKFLLDGDEISVKREKAFGIIYARKPSTAKIAARVQLVSGDWLAVKSLTMNDDKWKLESLTGSTWTIGVEQLSLADFSLGKVVYLSAMEPRSVKYTRRIPFPEGTLAYGEYRRDRNLDGRPLRLYGKTYARGLAIHSKTEMVYRLGGDFRRFQAMLGIDDEITDTRWGATSIRILGDRKELYTGVCRPREAAVPLDLDVTGVVELEIVVDYGPDKDDISDRVHLADARLVK